MKFLLKKRGTTQGSKFLYKKEEESGSPEIVDGAVIENRETDDGEENPWITDVVGETTTNTFSLVGSFSPHSQRHPATLGID